MEWGLGHATRCIPLIKAFLHYGCEVIIAGEGATYSLLKSEFPGLQFLPLRGYRIKLSRKKSSFFWKMLSQFPKIIYAIYYERKWLKRIIKQYKINAVISDNRVGLYNKQIVSVYITHQLLVKTGNIITSKIAGYIHKYFIRKFHECWVPDFAEDNLAGELSHPFPVPENVKYIGALSRCEKRDGMERKHDLLIILSGPEPQRSILEKILLHDLKFYSGKVLMIRGMPDDKEALQLTQSSTQIINHLSADKLCKALQQADLVICRSGYTSIMDLVKLNKKAILIPTPGQAEQEYLARYLKEKQLFFSIGQKDFNLGNALEKFSKFRGNIPVFEMEKYKLVVEKFVESNKIAATFI